MKRKLLFSCLFAVCAAASAGAHDLFLKLDTYFLQPNDGATVRLFNGTFSKSDGRVKQDRLRDVSLINPAGEILQSPQNAWRDEGETSLFDIRTSAAGTYVVGVSTKHREIDLKAADFNDYLEHDGIPDTLAERKKNGHLNKDAREQYSKHVKAVFQVGDERTDNFKKRLNYPAEIVPQQNPYALKVGQNIEFLCLLDGKPISNQFVTAGWEGENKEKPSLSARTDNDGIARFELKAAGKWYIKFIHMASLKDSNLDFESKWATLTFEIK